MTAIYEAAARAIWKTVTTPPGDGPQTILWHELSAETRAECIADAAVAVDAAFAAFARLPRAERRRIL